MGSSNNLERVCTMQLSTKMKHQTGVNYAFVSPITILSSSSYSSSCSLFHRPIDTIKTQQQRRRRTAVPVLKNNRSSIRCTLTEDNNTATTPSENNGNEQQQQPSQLKVSEENNSSSLRLTAAERARTLVQICKSATLCTASVRHDGIPFGSHVDFIQDEKGNPVFLLAANANHTRNLASEPRCSLFCQPSLQAGQDGCRVTIVGQMEPLNKELESDLRLKYEDIHAHASEALKYKDVFKFYTMNVNDIFFVSGYGVLSQWVNSIDFQNATPDALAFDAPDILKHLNTEKHADLKRLCRIFLNNNNNNNNNTNNSDMISCVMTSLDRLGFDLRVNYNNSQTKEFRVAFRENVSNRFDVQSSLVKTFQEAWERENGFDETWDEEDTRPTILYYSQSPM